MLVFRHKMLTLVLFNNSTNLFEIEFNTDNERKMFYFYWDIINAEIKENVTSEGQLLEKIDWWENKQVFPEYMEIDHDEIIIFSDGEYCLNPVYLTDIFNYELNTGYKSSLLMELIQTNTTSATAPPKKTLLVTDSVRADYLNVMKAPFYYQHQTQNEFPGTV